MGIENDGTTTDTGTGAVSLPEEPITYIQTPGHPVGTGAVDGPDKPVVVEFGPYGQEPTGQADVPVAYKIARDGTVKVVNAPKRAAAEGQTTAETEGQPVSGRRAAQPSDDSGH